jgi:hypothetical protein
LLASKRIAVVTVVGVSYSCCMEALPELVKEVAQK